MSSPSLMARDFAHPAGHTGMVNRPTKRIGTEPMKPASAIEGKGFWWSTSSSQLQAACPRPSSPR